ncbi:hypothetical protein B0H14DRAFT_2576356 [Mycena olivaceomarginata]|nr:hypothetical protein B0H14DRAFT_2576356 [Mycena olivaceomarginata]
MKPQAERGDGTGRENDVRAAQDYRHEDNRREAAASQVARGSLIASHRGIRQRPRPRPRMSRVASCQVGTRVGVASPRLDRLDRFERQVDEAEKKRRQAAISSDSEHRTEQNRIGRRRLAGGIAGRRRTRRRASGVAWDMGEKRRTRTRTRAKRDHRDVPIIEVDEGLVICVERSEDRGKPARNGRKRAGDCRKRVKPAKEYVIEIEKGPFRFEGEHLSKIIKRRGKYELCRAKHRPSPKYNPKTYRTCMRLGTDSSRVKLNKIDILALFGLLRALHLQELKEHCETRSKSYGRGIRSGMQALEAGRHSKWRLEVRGRAFEGLERRRQEFEVWGDGRSKWECMCSKWAGGRSKWPVTSSKWAGVRSGRAYRRSKWVRRGFERGDVAGRRGGSGAGPGGGRSKSLRSALEVPSKLRERGCAPKKESGIARQKGPGYPGYSNLKIRTNF